MPNLSEGDISMYEFSHVSRSEEASGSEPTSKSTDDLIVAGEPFFGKHRMIKDYDTKGDVSEVCLIPSVWSNLPEELMIQIFARLPVKAIPRIRSLNKHWRSAITSPCFQQAFSDASVVRVGLMISDWKDGVTFLTQEKKEECFRNAAQFRFARCLDSDGWIYVAATADGLVCVIETLRRPCHRISVLGLRGHSTFRTVGVRVYVMNLVTGTRRQLPSPLIGTAPPKLVRMETNVEGGYTITFIYTKYLELAEVSSWQVYNSSRNTWSADEVGALTHLKDVEIFNLHSDEQMFYDNMATFQKETKAINVFNLHSSRTGRNVCNVHGLFPERYLSSDPNGHAHNISGELFKLCKRGEQYGVWKCTCSGTWEMVCECPYFEEMWSCLRVVNDWVVLILKLPIKVKPSFNNFAGTIVKVYHMPTKSWHTFPEEEYYMRNFGYRRGEMFNMTFVVELKFDAIP